LIRNPEAFIIYTSNDLQAMKRTIFLLLGSMVFAGSFLVPAQAQDNRLVVAADGSGDYTTIGEALEACRAFQDSETVVFIRNGTYREKLHIDSFLSNIRLLGESKEGTIITYDDYAALNDMGTFRTYTLKITGNDITLENLTVQNTAGFDAGQAVALHVEGDRFKAINCRIIANQDTLYAAGDNSRQYYRDCLIEGSTDFIFGSATAVFDDCRLHSKKNSYVTAANTPEGKNFGYVFRHCELTAAPGVNRVYLGRPWRDFARVVYLHCHLGDHIVPEGWHNWSRPEREKTAFYAEYQNIGPGAETGQRVDWSHQITAEEAATYTDENIFRYCSSWEVPSSR
jgi:pectinesterase